jgi:hypothetical protein
MIKERPILFSGEMVRATRDGRKSQTRRVVKLPSWSTGDWEDFEIEAHTGTPVAICADTGCFADVPCPYGQRGDHLIVKETFLYRAQKQAVIYRADLDPAEAAGVGAMYGGWKPSIFMPLKFSRITLEIASEKIERVQSISQVDALKEGTQGKRSYAALWDSINGKKYPWSENPWVWVIEFRKL